MKLIILILFCLISRFANSEDNPVAAVKATLASKSLLLDITIVDQKMLVAVGERGHILTSFDGTSWQQMNVPVQTTLTKVFFINGQLGWAVGHDATILHTDDGGKKWNIQQYLPNKESPLFDITFIDKNHGIAVGAYGQFYRTIDGGNNWQSEFHQEFLTQDDSEFLDELKIDDPEGYLEEIESILPHFNRVFKDDSTLYMVGEAGLIRKSNDLGRTWEKMDDIYTGSFFDIARTKKGTLLTVGLRGHIYRSLDNGISWRLSKNPSKALLNNLFLGEKHQIFVVGNNGELLESLNDGRTFSAKIKLDGKSLIDGVWFKDKIVMVTNKGVNVL